MFSSNTALTKPPLPGPRYRRITPDFVQRSAGARSVLVLLWGALGDVVHSFPALWSIRQAYPQARIDVLTSGSGAALLALLPWIDRRIIYASRKSGLTLAELRLIFALRRTGYDVSINLPGTNHGCVLVWAAGVRHRIGRRPYWDKKAGWRLLQHEVMDCPYAQEPMYRQWLNCLAQGGFSAEAVFNVQLPDEALDGTSITKADRGSYFHISPNCSSENGELPAEQMAELLEQLHRRLPQYRIVLSSMATERERSRMAAIRQRLSFKPWQIYEGSLDVIQLAGVIRNAALHLSGNTGPLHIAWMLDTPSLSWFRVKFDNQEYLPPPPRHRSLLSRTEDAELTGIDTAALGQAALELLGAVPSRGAAG